MTDLLRLPDVVQATGLSKSTIYQLASKGQFPKQIKLTERASAWAADEVSAWIKARREKRNQAV